MAAITNLDNLVQLMSDTGSTETIYFHKNTFYSGTVINQGVSVPTPLWNTASGFALRLWSSFLIDGYPGRGNAPTTPTICTNTTDGALKQTHTVGKEKFLIQFGATNNLTNSIVILYDRLAHMGGLSGNTTATQTVNTPALTRYSGTSSIGNMIFVEIYATLGTTNANFTVTYTNQDGTSGRTGSFTLQSTSQFAGQVYPIRLQAGDTGVRSVESVALSSSTGTQGNFGITIGRPISIVAPLINGTADIKDFATGLPGIPKIERNACLCFLFNTANPIGEQSLFSGMLTFVEK